MTAYKLPQRTALNADLRASTNCKWRKALVLFEAIALKAFLFTQIASFGILHTFTVLNNHYRSHDFWMGEESQKVGTWATVTSFKYTAMLWNL